MKHTKEKHIIWIPILLILSFLIFPLMHQKKEQNKGQKTAAKTEQTGFLDYDLLPEVLKQEMEKLQKDSPSFPLYFSYFFENDDINHRYYIKDAQHQIIKAMPVTNQEALALVEEKMAHDNGSGHTYGFQKPSRQQKTAQLPFHKSNITYVLPEDKAQADFPKLRVGILKMHFPSYVSNHSDTTPDTRTYRLSEVDQPPEPIHGLAYFKKVVTDEIRNRASFLYADLDGEVVVEFTIGSKARSPQIIEGFSTRSDTHEAYRTDGAIIKAINDSKVHWIPAQHQGKPVNVRLSVTFSFNKQDQEVLLSMSDIQEADKTW